MTVVAIDGPAGAGKSTVARAVAEALGFAHLDTGALYRVVAVAVLDRGVDPQDAEEVEGLAGSLHLAAQEGRAFLDGADVTDRLRSSDVSRVASIISAYQGVRDAVLEPQREVAARGEVVMEGRDIASVVVPDAAVKIFLTASLRERAARRADELTADGDTSSVDEVAASLADRDRADAVRGVSPLAKSPDAIEIDSTDKTVGEIVDEIVEIVARARS